MGFFDEVGDTFSDAGRYISNTGDIIKSQVGDAFTFWTDKGKEMQGFLNKNVYHPFFDLVRPITQTGGKLFDMKNDFIDSNIPWAYDFLNVVELIPGIGDSLTAINDIEKFLKLVNARQYNQAQKFAIKRGIYWSIKDFLPPIVGGMMVDETVEKINDKIT